MSNTLASSSSPFDIQAVIRPLDDHNYAMSIVVVTTTTSTTTATTTTTCAPIQPTANVVVVEDATVTATDAALRATTTTTATATTTTEVSSPSSPSKSLFKNTKDLVLVLDVSGSMAGAPLNQSKEAICTLLSFLHDNGGVDGNHITLITFSDDAYTVSLSGGGGGGQMSLESQLQTVSKVSVIGGTNFTNAFKAIGDVEYKSSSAAIVFFTDGQDFASGNREQVKMEMVSKLKSKVGAFEFHTIGFSSYHDVQLLTDITQQGTAQGTFQYVKESKDIPVAIDNLSPLVIGSSMVGTLIIDSDKEKQQRRQKLSFNSDKDGHAYNSKSFFQTEEPCSQLNFIVEMSMGDETFTHSLKPTIMNPDEMSTVEKASLGIEFIECELLKLTQEIANANAKNSKEELKVVKQKLQALDEKLTEVKERKYESRLARKRLLTQCVEVSEVVNQINSILAEATVSHLSNDKLATLNALGYKSITKSGLQKKMDQRAQENVDLFERLELAVAKTVEKTDFDTLRQQHQEEADELGKCLISCNNWIDALEDQDCLCITLDISRSQAAIADPSQVKVKAINQSLMTAESFLDSVMYSLGNANDATAVHGGFDKYFDAQVLTGVARESITAVLPLYINKTHWAVAKHKMKSVMGFVCTLNVLGYTYSQVKTVPFLVLAEACKNVNTDFGRKQFNLIKETCKQIYRDSSTPNLEFKMSEIVKQQFENYIADPAARTVDVIASNAVFLAQLLCAVELGNVSVDNVDLNRFFQCVAEEELRRSTHQNNEFTPVEIMSLLNVDKGQIVDKFISDFEDKYNRANQQGSGSATKHYAQSMLHTLKNAGVDVSDLESDDSSSVDGSAPQEEKKEVDNSDLRIVAPVEGYEGSMENLSSEAAASIRNYERMMQKRVAPLLNMRQFISKEPYEPYTNLASVGFSSNESLVCLVIQSKQHARNLARKQAIESGTYIDPINDPKTFLKKTYVKVVTEARQAGVTAFFNMILEGKAAQLASDFCSASSVLEAAGALYGTKLGTVAFPSVVHRLQSREWPLAVQKIELLTSCQFRGVQLVLDRPVGWKPSRVNVYRFWKANRGQIADEATFLALFGDEYKSYYASRMYYLEKGII